MTKHETRRGGGWFWGLGLGYFDMRGLRDKLRPLCAVIMLLDVTSILGSEVNSPVIGSRVTPEFARRAPCLAAAARAVSCGSLRGLRALRAASEDIVVARSEVTVK